MSLAPAAEPRTVWIDKNDPDTVRVIEQRLLPFEHCVVDLRSTADMVDAIADMVVRGAGCIGACAGYGMYLAALETADMAADGGDTHLREAAVALEASRPTAVNLTWAVGRQLRGLLGIDDDNERIARAREIADAIADEDVERCAAIGRHGLEVIREIHARTGRPVQVMTHCNAGWLAFVSHGSATAPIYAAHDAGIPLHVWVSETRPRNQGARLTAWELADRGVPLTLIADNSAGHLMQHGKVDLVVVGSDRTTIAGDVANKIGTYMKAVLAQTHDVPFYVALPSSTFDPTIRDGIVNIPIEERGAVEVTHCTGWLDGRQVEPSTSVLGVDAVNYGFDVTPAAYVTGLISERGICAADEAAIVGLYPELGGQVA